MKQTMTGYNAQTRMVHVTRACGCEAEIHVKGIKEARFYQQWLGEKKCRECGEKKEN